jgi:hypothetical protein
MKMEDLDAPVRPRMDLPAVQVEDDVSVITYTQNVFKSIIGGLAPQGVVPTDPETVNLIMKAADNMNKVALTRLRIKADEKIADKSAEARLQIAEMLRQKEALLKDLPTAFENTAPALPTELDRPALVPGIMDISPAPEDVRQFLGRVHVDLGPSPAAPVI